MNTTDASGDWPAAMADTAAEDGEQCIRCLRFTYDSHTDRCLNCESSLRPAYGLEAGTIECPMCGVVKRCYMCGGCDCECVCGED